jgi:hypothetical protein
MLSHDDRWLRFKAAQGIRKYGTNERILAADLTGTTPFN